MNNPVIRPAEAGDAAALVALIDALNHHEAGLVDDRRTDILAARECLASLQARIARDGGGLHVAVTAGAVVGMIGWVIEVGEPYLQAHLRKFALITDLVVAEGQRGAGVGRALIRSVEDEARLHGLPRLAISVLAANHAAIDAYRSQGFAPDMQIMMKAL
ncbi:MAG: GNAT family N-acetyltransferase [Salinarimonas sp.]|nr:GNAT family N-acetyltransferase [Salinarimonas sp.]